MSHTLHYIQPSAFDMRYDIGHETEQRRKLKVVAANRDDLEGELLDTGDRVKRWFKRYNSKRPQFA